MSSFLTVSIPAFEFHFNLVVCPIPSTWLKNVCLKQLIIHNNFNEIFSQDESFVFVLKNNGVEPIPTGGSHWLQLLPNHMYCFLPSYEADKSEAKVYNFIPRQLAEFIYCMKVEKVGK